MPSVSENSWIFEVGLDIGFQTVNCFLLLVILLVVLSSLCTLILKHGVK